MFAAASLETALNLPQTCNRCCLRARILFRNSMQAKEEQNERDGPNQKQQPPPHPQPMKITIQAIHSRNAGTPLLRSERTRTHFYLRARTESQRRATPTAQLCSDLVWNERKSLAPV